jgi:CelD/BcsL family acetyltransferase involved in cellulose biosynthesis
LADDEEAERDLCRALFARPAHRVTLRFVPEERLAPCREAARRAGHLVLERENERSPWISCAGSWDDYAAGLGAKMRREVRRRRRLLEWTGALTIEVLDGSERLDTLLDEGFAVEAAGWKGDGGTAIVSHVATARFYREVAAWAAARGWLRLGFLHLDGRALAFDFAIEAGRVHYLLKTGFDAGHRASAPGKLLRAEMIRRAFDGPALSYEFLGANEPWKREWTTRQRDLRRLDAFPRSVPGVANWTAFACGRPLAKRAKALARP